MSHKLYSRDARVRARGPDPARLYVTSGPRVIRGEYIFSFYFFLIFQILFLSNFSNFIFFKFSVESVSWSVAAARLSCSSAGSADRDVVIN